MRIILTICALLMPAALALGQSSSLIRQHEQKQQAQFAATTQPAANGSLQPGQTAIALTPPAAPPAAGFQPAAPNGAPVYSALTTPRRVEPRVMQVNDLVGVIVRHRLRFQSDSRTEQQSEWDVNSKLDAWFRIHENKWVQQPFRGGTPEVKFNSENELENEGRANRRDAFEVRVMAKVIDIKPNGNLIIQASTSIQHDDEDQYIIVTGECHKDHIGPDGNVLSDKIYNLNVETKNAGAVRDATKRGWLKETLDKLKPF